MTNEIVPYDEAFAAAAEQYAKQDRASEGSFLSTKAGVLALGEDQFPGNQLAAVIVDSVLENAFYAGAYDPTKAHPPTCYAFSREEPDDMFPHLESMARDKSFFMPQNILPNGQIGGCHGCPMAEWGTAMRNGQPGRGKACKNQYRLALLNAGHYRPVGRGYELGLIDDPAHYAASDVVFLKLPVTSGSSFEKYRKMLRVQHARPPFGAVTRIFLTPHQTNQFTVNFELVELLPNELAGVVIDRNKALVNEPFRGYEAPNEFETAHGIGNAPTRRR